MKKQLLRLAVAVIVASSVSIHAAIDVFLALYDMENKVVPGESLDKNFPGKDGWFKIKEFNFGIENTNNLGSASGGAGSGKAKFNEFTIKKTVDSVSPKLFAALARAQHYKTVKLAIRKAGGAETPNPPYLEYQFSFVFANKQEWSGEDGGDAPSEDIVFVFGAMQLSYRSQKPDGSLNPADVSAWNMVQNNDTFPVVLGD